MQWLFNVLCELFCWHTFRNMTSIRVISHIFAIATVYNVFWLLRYWLKIIKFSPDGVPSYNSHQSTKFCNSRFSGSLNLRGVLPPTNLAFKKSDRNRVKHHTCLRCQLPKNLTCLSFWKKRRLLTSRRLRGSHRGTSAVFRAVSRTTVFPHQSTSAASRRRRWSEQFGLVGPSLSPASLTIPLRRRHALNPSAIRCQDGGLRSGNTESPSML